MGAIDEADSRRLPEQLYHYTSCEVFSKIIESSSLWATHIRFMSDTEEWRYALSLLKEMSGEVAALSGQPDVEAQIKDACARFETNHLFVACFSEKPDLLSQWRGYSPHGLSIGFRTDRLTPLLRSGEIGLASCVYDLDLQKGIIREIAETEMVTMAKISADFGEPGENVFSFLIQFLLNWAPRFKSRHFEEEAEWRLISHPLKKDDSRIRYRPTGNSFVPYLPLSLGTDARALPFGTITLGPGTHRRTQEAVELFLDSRGSVGHKVVASAIPFDPAG